MQKWVEKPNTHLTTITIDIALLLYCILSDKKVYIHKLIHKKMHPTIESSVLVFPSLVMKFAAKHGIDPEETEVMMDPSVRVKVIPHGIKFKDTPVESSKVHRKHSTSDGSSSNPVALFYKKLACVETRIINQLKCNDRRNKRWYDRIMKMLEEKNPGPEELDISEEETDGLDDKGSDEEEAGSAKNEEEEEQASSHST
ncbi:hypothetical protein PIB30_088154 [Stylosanthes scabra]|uniref:Uncharacterized protein n=1 Tax=Stylosanthes scabra TaxID=79078 RepID=A0ABU6QT52_9FABA|nr:hypothetical protein [Stylosanthes scabra]